MRLFVLDHSYSVSIKRVRTFLTNSVEFSASLSVSPDDVISSLNAGVVLGTKSEVDGCLENMDLKFFAFRGRKSFSPIAPTRRDLRLQILNDVALRRGHKACPTIV